MRIKLTGEITMESLQVAFDTLQTNLDAMLEKSGDRIVGFWGANIYVHPITDDGHEIDFPGKQFFTLDLSDMGRPRPDRNSELVPVVKSKKASRSQKFIAPTEEEIEATLRAEMGDKAYEELQARKIQKDRDFHTRGDRRDVNKRLQQEINENLMNSFKQEFGLDPDLLVTELNACLEDVWKDKKPIHPPGSIKNRSGKAVGLPVFRCAVSRNGKKLFQIRRTPENEFISIGTPFPNNSLWHNPTWSVHALPKLISVFSAIRAKRGAEVDPDWMLTIEKAPILPAAVDAWMIQDSLRRNENPIQSVLGYVRETLKLDLATAKRLHPDYFLSSDDEYFNAISKHTDETAIS